MAAWFLLCLGWTWMSRVCVGRSERCRSRIASTLPVAQGSNSFHRAAPRSTSGVSRVVLLVLYCLFCTACSCCLFRTACDAARAAALVLLCPFSPIHAVGLVALPSQTNPLWTRLIALSFGNSAPSDGAPY